MLRQSSSGSADHPPGPPTGAPPSAQRRGDGSLPPKLGSAATAPNCSPLSPLGLHVDGTVEFIGSGGTARDSGRKQPSYVPLARPPNLPRPPHLISPTHGPRTVQWRIELSPTLRPWSCPPQAPAGAGPKQGGGSGNAPLPDPRLRATPRLRAAPLHKRGLCQTRGGHLPGPPPKTLR